MAAVERSITLVAVEDAVDTSTANGRHLVPVMSRLALMDKGLRNERTQVSLAIAKMNGRTGGRPPASADNRSQAELLQGLADDELARIQPEEWGRAKVGAAHPKPLGSASRGLERLGQGAVLPARSARRWTGH